MEYNLSKDFARKLGIMLRAELINYKYYSLWCDEVIQQLDNPPFWIIELSIARFLPAATDVVNEYAFSEPFEQFSNDCHDLFIACLLLKYDIHQISWATFLSYTGHYSDGNSTKIDCGYIYDLLDKYENSSYSLEIENNQYSEIKNRFNLETNEMRIYYNYFGTYFDRYVKNKKE